MCACIVDGIAAGRHEQLMQASGLFQVTN
jgi:hypothetical protein